MDAKKYENEWDRTHFETNFEERIKYLTQILKLDENKIIKENNGKEEVLKVLEKHWAIFDITEQKLGRIKSNVKHTIQIEKGKGPVRSKTRPLNPIVGKKVKAQLDEWLKKGSLGSHFLRTRVR